MDAAQQNTASLVTNDDLLQTKIDAFVKNLKDMGLTQEQTETIAMSVATTSTQQTLAKISALMSEEDFEKWKAYVDTGPNTAQQLIIMNRFLINRTKKDLETLQSEIIDALIKNTLDDISHAKDLRIKISQLSSEEAVKAKELLDAGDYIGADKIINKEYN